MKRITEWKTRLKAAKAELPMRRRMLNSAARSLRKLENEIQQLEMKIERHMARS